MKLDRHGLKMAGIKAASGETCDYGYLSDRYVEIFYDRATGEVWTVFQCSLGQNMWSEYNDPDVIKICNTDMHMTMQEIADAIARKVREIDAWAAYEKAAAQA